jgi:hypothetical protein
MNKKSKKPVPRKTKKTISKGSKLSCKECGLQVKVVDDCGCASPCDLMCCGEQMIVSC